MPLSHLIESQLQALPETQRSPRQRLAAWGRGLGTAAAGIVVTAAIARGLAGLGWASAESLSVLFVLPVLVSAILHGLGMALVAAGLAVAAYSALLPASAVASQSLVKAAILVLVAVIGSALAGRVRRLADEAMVRERTLSALYALSQDAIAVSSVAAMRAAIDKTLSRLLGRRAEVVLDDEPDAAGEEARKAVAVNGPVRRIGGEDGGSLVFLPLIGAKGPLGVLRIVEDPAAPLTQRFRTKILATLAAQSASAIEKARTAEARERDALNAERERLLSALLMSISHDLKTPLVTIIGALSELKRSAPTDDGASNQLAATGLEEAIKLNRFITNLLELSRLEAGITALRQEPVLLRDLLASALRSLQPVIGTARIRIDVPADFPLLNVNPGLMELVFLNLIENAVKYGPAGGEVRVAAREEPGGVIVEVDDGGPGIAVAERERVFDKFYRSGMADRRIAGTGIGLYICREIVRAHGGSVIALGKDGAPGARLRVWLPTAAVVPLTTEPEKD
jgi:two-component system sensor histidine kinase KdpD